jgi:hypothetical protein
MNLIPPPFKFKGNKNKAISLKSIASEFYRSSVNQAVKEGLRSITRTKILPDGSVIEVGASIQSIYDNVSGRVVITSPSIPHIDSPSGDLFVTLDDNTSATISPPVDYPFPPFSKRLKSILYFDQKTSKTKTNFLSGGYGYTSTTSSQYDAAFTGSTMLDNQINGSQNSGVQATGGSWVGKDSLNKLSVLTWAWQTGFGYSFYYKGKNTGTTAIFPYNTGQANPGALSRYPQEIKSAFIMENNVDIAARYPNIPIANFTHVIFTVTNNQDVYHLAVFGVKSNSTTAFTVSPINLVLITMPLSINPARTRSAWIVSGFTENTRTICICDITEFLNPTQSSTQSTYTGLLNASYDGFNFTLLEVKTRQSIAYSHTQLNDAGSPIAIYSGSVSASLNSGFPTILDIKPRKDDFEALGLSLSDYSHSCTYSGTIDTSGVGSSTFIHSKGLSYNTNYEIISIDALGILQTGIKTQNLLQSITLTTNQSRSGSTYSHSSNSTSTTNLSAIYYYSMKSKIIIEGISTNISEASVNSNPSNSSQVISDSTTTLSSKIKDNLGTTFASSSTGATVVGFTAAATPQILASRGPSSDTRVYPLPISFFRLVSREFLSPFNSGSGVAASFEIIRSSTMTPLIRTAGNSNDVIYVGVYMLHDKAGLMIIDLKTKATTLLPFSKIKPVLSDAPTNPFAYFVNTYRIGLTTEK